MPYLANIAANNIKSMIGARADSKHRRAAIGWVRVNNDYILIAITTGVITSIITQP